jgi:hypothetical protein
VERCRCNDGDFTTGHAHFLLKVSLPEGIRHPNKVSGSNIFLPVDDNTMILQGNILRYTLKNLLLSSCKVMGLISR